METIIYFNDFGKATFEHGILTAVIDKGFQKTGAFTKKIEVRFIDLKGVAQSIETLDDIAIYEGILNLIPNKEWKAFSAGDFLKLTHQANKKDRKFLRVDQRIKSDLRAGIISLQKDITVPVNKRVLGPLIQKQLVEG